MAVEEVEKVKTVKKIWIAGWCVESKTHRSLILFLPRLDGNKFYRTVGDGSLELTAKKMFRTVFPANGFDWRGATLYL